MSRHLSLALLCGLLCQVVQAQSLPPAPSQPPIYQSVIALRLYPGGRNISLVVSERADTHDLSVMTLSNDPGGVGTVFIFGAGKTLAICRVAICNVTWPKASMAAGSNALTVISIAKGGTMTLYVQVDRPTS